MALLFALLSLPLLASLVRTLTVVMREIAEVIAMNKRIRKQTRNNMANVDTNLGPITDEVPAVMRNLGIRIKHQSIPQQRIKPGHQRHVTTDAVARLIFSVFHEALSDGKLSFYVSSECQNFPASMRENNSSLIGIFLLYVRQRTENAAADSYFELLPLTAYPFDLTVRFR
jgi:hypothetical protein